MGPPPLNRVRNPFDRLCEIFVKFMGLCKTGHGDVSEVNYIIARSRRCVLFLFSNMLVLARA